MSGMSRCQAITASTANSGITCSQARIASARPCETKNWAASAPQASMNALPTIEGNVQIAWRAPRWASSGETCPLITARSEAGHAGELEVTHLEGRGHHAVADVVELRGFRLA